MMEMLEFESKISGTLDNEKDKAYAYLNFSEGLANEKMDPTPAAFKALHMFQDIKDSNGIAQTSILIANYLHDKGQHEHALNYLLIAKERLEGAENEKLASFVFNKLGFIYFNLKKYDKAIENYMDCVELLEKLGDLNEIPKIYVAMGLIYQDLGQGEKANEMFGKAAEISMDAGNDAEAQKYISFIM